MAEHHGRTVRFELTEQSPVELPDVGAQLQSFRLTGIVNPPMDLGELVDGVDRALPPSTGDPLNIYQLSGVHCIGTKDATQEPPDLVDHFLITHSWLSFGKSHSDERALYLWDKLVPKVAQELGAAMLRD